MWPVMHDLGLRGLHADALFASGLQPGEEPVRAPGGDMMAYGLLCGVMVAQGRFGEARHWLGRARHVLQPEAEPGFGPDRTVGTQAIRGGVARPLGLPTRGETRVLCYLPTHLHTTEIADELNLSANTVRTHVRHLYQKLGAHSRGEAVERARVFGLLGSSPRSG